MAENEILGKKSLISASCVWGEIGNRASEEEVSPISSLHLGVVFFVFFIFFLCFLYILLWFLWIYRVEIGANGPDFGEFCSVLFVSSSEGKKCLAAFLRKGIIWILYGSAINVTDVILDLSWWQRKIRSP